ncbi:hypothetical protein TL16_g07666 [Triparma laevis f. inornata]|uniref:Uncharacterized protein n=1 Tax=Triparma laevis f. inornata TaxID=1714386 RepID=A0A9W7AZ26_9STRA|nr:hypothetical protein TL16_g07666 [Triparma laevis f. inornata]
MGTPPKNTFTVERDRMLALKSELMKRLKKLERERTSQFGLIPLRDSDSSSGSTSDQLVFISSSDDDNENIEDSGASFFDSIRHTESDGVEKFPSPMSKARTIHDKVDAKSIIVPRRKNKVGLTIRIVLTLLMGYFDVITDFKVAYVYYYNRQFVVAYYIAGFAVFTLLIQAAVTIQQHKQKGWAECYGRALIALLGGAPIMEGAAVWIGKEDPTLLFPPTVMFAGIKGIEVAFEAVPGSIVQCLGLLSARRNEVHPIQIVGLCSSIFCGAFVMTDGNFGFICGKHRASPNDPYYQWVPNTPALSTRLMCKFGMFLFFVCYFSQFVYTMSIFVDAFGFCLAGQALAAELALLCMYKAYKGELCGVSILSHPTPLTNYVLPFLLKMGYYVLVCACPMLITAAPCELGPEVFAAIIVWRLSTNGVVSYVAISSENYHCDHMHNMSSQQGLIFNAVTLSGALIGLRLFFKNCCKKFNVSLFWKPKSGKEHIESAWRDPEVWGSNMNPVKTKDDDYWEWAILLHPTYLPLEELTSWLCYRLVKKYADRTTPRPSWMSGYEEIVFIKRILTIYNWKGVNEEEAQRVDDALETLFTSKSPKDLEWAWSGVGGGGAAKFRFFEKVKPRKDWLWKRRKVGSSVWESFMT